jgi:hypothetical protein
MIKKYYQLMRKNIAPVQFIIEGYGEMATVTTLDSRKAIIRVSVIPDFIDDLNGLLDYLKKKYTMVELSDYHEK